MSAPRASRSRSVWPDVEMHTGSITRAGIGEGSALRVCATARTTSALASMPVLMAATSMSPRTDRSCGW
jgi:hypothetical protein